jgi:hypothetical protein
MIKCFSNSQCDFCDARCANYYEETDEYYSWYAQIATDDGTDYVKITKYKTPHFENDKQVLFTIEVPDTKEEH